MYKCAVTIDVDLVSDSDDISNDRSRFQKELWAIREILMEVPDVKVTAFIRVDAGVEQKYGNCMWFFKEYEEELRWMRQNGHQLGWHLHSLWPLHNHEESVLEEIKRFSKYAQQLGIVDTFRIGNSIMSNRVMGFLESVGVRYECSALPRPHYPWIRDDIDWAKTPQECYFPSKNDYRNRGQKRGILEIPMSTATIPASYDSYSDILRYINPAYKAEVFLRAVEQIQRDFTVIFHPHEMVDCIGTPHELLSYSAETLKRNLICLAEKYSCVTICDYAQEYMED